MADLADTDVTVTVQAGTPYNPRIEGTKKKCIVKIEFGDGALTYPSGGVPMPSYLSFGLTRNLEDLVILDKGSSLYEFDWDRTDKTLHMLNPGAELAAGVDAPAAQTLYAEAIGW